VSRTCGSTTSNYTAAFWTSGNDPCTSSGGAGTGQPWGLPTACGGGGATATATATTSGTTPTATTRPTATATATGPTPTNPPAGKNIAGYFAQWGIYGRAFYPKNIPSGVNVINYAFNNPHNGKCETGVSAAGVGDAFADYGKSYDAATSIDGVADTWADANQLPYAKGNFGQLKKYKKANPGSKVVISIGGWTWSDGFYGGATAANRAAFVSSCIDQFIKGNLVLDTGDNAGGPGTAAGIFDGIDLDWEYPGVCGNNPSCGASSNDKGNTGALITEFRNQLNAVAPGLLLTQAVGAGTDKIANYDVPTMNAGLDFFNIMTYDFFGAWAPTGPTAPHSPLYQFTGQASYPPPTDKYYSDAAVQAWKTAGASASKIQLGIGFYGRGWTMPTPACNSTGLNCPATGAAPGTYEAGIDDYKVLVSKCPSNNTGFGTAWCNGSGQWWSYDTSAAIATKGSYKNAQGLGGWFIWSFDGDEASHTLYNAMKANN
jgi:chitinase